MCPKNAKFFIFNYHKVAKHLRNVLHFCENLGQKTVPFFANGSSGESKAARPAAYALQHGEHGAAAGELRGPRSGKLRTGLDRANFTGLVLGCIEAKICRRAIQQSREKKRRTIRGGAARALLERSPRGSAAARRSVFGSRMGNCAATFWSARKESRHYNYSEYK